MTPLQAVIFSIVEGLTEFLPISSTGHLILTSFALGVQQTDFVKSFEVIIQLGAILAVVFVYAKRVLTTPAIIARVATAFIPTALVGLLLYKTIKEVLLGNIWVTLWALFVGGVALILLEYVFKKIKKEGSGSIESMSLPRAFGVGLAQSIAVIPGVSRSASTIIGATMAGLSREAAVEFSFLLAIPTMVAATGLDLIKTNFSFSTQEYTILAIGLIGSFATALIAIRFFLGFIKKHTFIGFGVYRIIIAVIIAIIILS